MGAFKPLNVSSSISSGHKDPSLKTLTEYHSELIKTMTSEEKSKYYMQNAELLMKYTEHNTNNRATILYNWMQNVKCEDYTQPLGNVPHDTELHVSECCQGPLGCNNDMLICDVCGKCSSRMLLFHEIPTMFGHTISTEYNHEAPGYRGNLILDKTQSDKTLFTYDRRHHFRDMVIQLQGKQEITIKDHEIKAIKSELAKYRISMNTIIKQDVRDILQKLGWSKLYEHASKIMNIINPSMAIQFSKDVCDRLDYMFDVIQEPFSRFSPKELKNLINYNYIFFKFCQILNFGDRPELKQYSRHFTMLKCYKKLVNMEHIWVKIIDEIVDKKLGDRYPDIDWRFVPLSI